MQTNFRGKFGDMPADGGAKARDCFFEHVTKFVERSGINYTKHTKFSAGDWPERLRNSPNKNADAFFVSVQKHVIGFKTTDYTDLTDFPVDVWMPQAADGFAQMRVGTPVKVPDPMARGGAEKFATLPPSGIHATFAKRNDFFCTEKVFY